MDDKVIYDMVKRVMSEKYTQKSDEENPESFSDSIRENDISLKEAKALCEKVREKAREIGVKSVCAVTNSGANPVCVECDDDSYIASYDIALNKAYTSVALKMKTSELAKLASPDGSLYGIQFTNGGKIVIFGGGVPLIREGKIIGGFGVSGGSAEEDTYLGDYAYEIFGR